MNISLVDIGFSIHFFTPKTEYLEHKIYRTKYLCGLNCLIADDPIYPTLIVRMNSVIILECEF